MDRAEAAGFGVAVAGHGLLLAALTFGLFAAARMPAPSDAIEVSFVDEVALESASPAPAAEPPAPATAPDIGAIEEAPAAPSPTPAPAAPQPTPRRATPAPERASPTAQTDPRDRRRPENARNRPGHESRAPRLGDLNLDNIGRDPSPNRTRNAPAATMNAQAAANIAQAILRQIQPCADRQVDPGPGANRIVTAINLRLNRDGSLAARPRVVRQTGITDENQRYADRVADLAIASFIGCAPLRGLPVELYDVPRGWSNFTMNYRLPD